MIKHDIFGVIVISLSTVGSAMAQNNRVAPAKKVPTATSQTFGPTDPAEMEAFLDGLFVKEMAEYHIAGAVVSVVKDGKLFFAKGYVTSSWYRRAETWSPRANG